jgi:uncharacterized membrane protein
MTSKSMDFISKILIVFSVIYLIVFMVFIATGGLSNKDWPAEGKYELRECTSND